MEICVFGDSVTYAGYIKDSWFNLLKDELETNSEEDTHMYNLGINGNTSADILQRFGIEAAARTPDKIIFAFGINDSGYIFSTGKPLVSEDEFKENIKNLLNLASKYTKDITFIGLVIGDDSVLQPYPESSKGKSYNHKRAQLYNAIIRGIAIDNKCNYIALYDKLTFDDFSDGLHPNDSGHRKMFEEIRKFIL